VRAGSNRYAGSHACSTHQGACGCRADYATGTDYRRHAARVHVGRVDHCQDRAR